jgi:hypothetical protein
MEAKNIGLQQNATDEEQKQESIGKTKRYIA